MIVDAAEKIVLDQGVGALSVRRITGAIGYSPGTLYQHFSSIGAVVTRLNDRTLGRLEDAMHAHDAALPPAERLYNFAAVYLSFIRANTRAWAALFDMRRDPNEPVPGWYADRINRLIEMIAGCFAAMGQGQTTPRRAAEMVWASVHAVCSLEAAGKLPLVSERGLDDQVRDLVAVHIAAFRGSATPESGASQP